MSLPSHYSPTSPTASSYGDNWPSTSSTGSPGSTRNTAHPATQSSWWTLRWTTPTTWSTAISTRAPTSGGSSPVAPTADSSGSCTGIPQATTASKPSPTRTAQTSASTRATTCSGRSPRDDPDVLVRGRVIVIGVDPGARWTGIVARDGNTLLGHLILRNGENCSRSSCNGSGWSPTRSRTLSASTTPTYSLSRESPGLTGTWAGSCRRQPVSHPRYRWGRRCGARVRATRLHSGGQCAAGKARQGTYGLLPRGAGL